MLLQCSPSPQFNGLWREPGDRTATGYRSIEHWVRVAKKLEAACFDALFFADTQGTYDVYRGSWDAGVRGAVQVPSIDPTLIIGALAAATRHLGFAVTGSTTYDPPARCARLFSSLDHLTGGRIGWNIVNSFLRSAHANGLGDDLEHDLRYDRADEYMEVVLALWERSWDDHAVVRDAATATFTDPARVHAIDHRGRWFNVRGPHICEPSPQRTPVLYQAGASERGTRFAARHAEVVFTTLPDLETGRRHVDKLRSLAVEAGRPRDSLIVLQAGQVLLGRTRAEARERVALLKRLSDPEGELAKWCGWTGFDLAAWPADQRISELRADGSHSVQEFLRRFDPEREWTIADLRQMALFARRPSRRMGWAIGTPERVADKLEAWLEIGVDGFNLFPCPPTGGIDDICDLLVPELQRRGLFRTAYDPERRTLRERYFGPGRRSYTGPC
jgi:FMN-dependent oxidoreductase (nitrilotriacetate monooxygenase family)